jgi:HEAT repeat protein
MNTASRAVVAVVLSFGAFAGPAVVADQGKSGDSTDWGCGGHPPTAGSVTHAGQIDKLVKISQEAWHVWWYLNRPTLLAGLSYRAAGPAGPPAAVEKWRDDARSVLRKAMSDSTASVAAEAALGLGRAGDAGDIEFLAKAVCDTSRPVIFRNRASLGMGLLPLEPTTAKATREAICSVIRESIGQNDDQLAMWGNAAFALGLRGDVAAVPWLADFLAKHRDYSDADHEHGVHREVMGALTGALGLLGDPDVLPELVVALQAQGGDGRTRERRAMTASFAAYAMARLGDRAALPALRKAAADDRLLVRRAAILALGALAEPDDADTTAVLLTVLATEKDAPTRGLAAVSLGRGGAAAAPAALRDAFADGLPMFRCYVALGLGLFSRRKTDAAVDAFLLEQLNATHDAVETGALSIANGLARNFAAAARLAAIATTEGDPEMRSHAAFALGLLGFEAVRPQVLLDLVVSGEPIVRHEAGLALGLARRVDGVDALIQVVQKGKGLHERGSAAVALGRIGGAEAAPVLIKIVKDEHESNQMRTCAVHGLGLLLDRTEGAKLGRIGQDVSWINEINHRYMATEVIDQLLLVTD